MYVRLNYFGAALAEDIGGYGVAALVVTAVVAPVLLLILNYIIEKRRAKDALEQKKALDELKADSKANGGATSRDSLNRIENNLKILFDGQKEITADIKSIKNAAESTNNVVSSHGHLIQSLIEKGLNGKS